MKVAKRPYRDKVESQYGDYRRIWDGLRAVMDYRSCTTGSTNMELAD